MSFPAEDYARRFHVIYESLAPAYGYKTREASAVPWEQVPEQNRQLMIATVQAVFSGLVTETFEALQAGSDQIKTWVAVCPDEADETDEQVLAKLNRASALLMNPGSLPPVVSVAEASS